MSVNQTKVAIQAAGGRTAVAKELGITRETIKNYIQRNKIPDKYVAQVSAMTGGMITPAQIRPDLADVFGAK